MKSVFDGEIFIFLRLNYFCVLLMSSLPKISDGIELFFFSFSTYLFKYATIPTLHSEGTALINIRVNMISA